MVNTAKLKGKIVENGFTIQTLSDKLNIDRSTLYRKFDEPNRFTIADVNALVDILHLSADDALLIFFDQFVA